MVNKPQYALSALYHEGGIPIDVGTGICMRGIEHLAPEERYRLKRANQICEQLSQEVGFDIEAVEQLAACVEFLRSYIDKAELWGRAQGQMEYRLNQ